MRGIVLTGALVAVVGSFISSPAGLAKCACENKASTLDVMAREAAGAAAKLPSEADRMLARNFRLQNLPVDAAQWYRSASTKAAAEVADANAKANASTPAISASDVEQIALHSASVHREAAAFFTQRGDAKAAAHNWEAAIAAELAAKKGNMDLAANKVNADQAAKPDLANEYGTVARLYEQAGDLAKAAEMFKKQADQLAAKEGRYSANAKFAYAEFTRLTYRLRTQSQPLRSAAR